jgi:hypothetical protein
VYIVYYVLRAIEKLGGGPGAAAAGGSKGQQYHSALEPGGYLSSPLVIWICLAAVCLIISIVLLRLVEGLKRIFSFWHFCKN